MGQAPLVPLTQRVGVFSSEAGRLGWLFARRELWVGARQGSKESRIDGKDQKQNVEAQLHERWGETSF